VEAEGVVSGPDFTSGSQEIELTEDENIQRLFRRIRNIPDDTFCDILTHWMDLELEEDKADDACLLSETIPAVILLSLDNISPTTTYFLVRDILRARGQDVSQIKIRSIRQGVELYLCRSDDYNVSSPELELALIVTRQFHEHCDPERRNMIQSVSSTLKQDNLTLHGQADDNKKADVDAPSHKDHFKARNGPPDDGDHEREPSADNKAILQTFQTSPAECEKELMIVRAESLVIRSLPLDLPNEARPYRLD
jgi:hypothetical protein